MKPIQLAIPHNVIIILNTNARVLINRAVLISLDFLLFRQIIENIRGRTPPKPQPMNILIIDHGNQSRILLISGAGTN